MEFKKGETTFAKLTRAGDFDTWRFRMQLYLQSIGVFSIVDGSEEAPPDPRVPAITHATTATSENDGESAARATVPTIPKVDRHALKDWGEY